MKLKPSWCEHTFPYLTHFSLLNTNLVLVDDFPSCNVGVEGKMNGLVNTFRGIFTDPRLLPQPLQMSAGACWAESDHLTAEVRLNLVPLGGTDTQRS